MGRARGPYAGVRERSTASDAAKARRVDIRVRIPKLLRVRQILRRGELAGAVVSIEQEFSA